jgi:hypothetical protein
MAKPIHNENEELSGGKYDFPALYSYFYENRNEFLFDGFSMEEFIYYLKLHT